MYNANMTLANLSDEELLTSLTTVCFETRRLLGRLLLLLMEVEERRLDLKSACSSLYDFCLRRLGMSESEAVRRIEAARLVKRFPKLLGAIERGDLHLTALLLLRSHFTDANLDELVVAAKGKSKRELQELVAARAPKPDVFASITALPGGDVAALGSSVGRRADGLQGAIAPSSPTAFPAQPSERASKAARIVPLSPGRYRVELTVGAEVFSKIERARELMGHSNPTGDLERVLERAFDVLLDRLERERLAETRRSRGDKLATAEKPQLQATATAEKPRANASVGLPTEQCVRESSARGRRSVSSERRHVPRANRRDVFARDGEQCTFTDAQGNRCACRARLELDHVVPHGKGGSDDVPNLRVLCRSHNRLHAEQSFGRTYVERRIDLRQRGKPQPAPVLLADEWNESLHCAERALVQMGFRSPDARRALQLMGAAATAPLAEVLRAALARLA